MVQFSSLPEQKCSKENPNTNKQDEKPALPN